MRLFKSKPKIVTANQFVGCLIPGVYFNEDRRTYYCITAQDVEVPITEGEWVILETVQTGPFLRAYPCADDVFHRSYEAV